MENCSLLLDNCTLDFGELNGTGFPDSENGTSYEAISCGEWEPAQHNLFQLCNFFFAAAFLVPRSYKQGIIILRYTIRYDMARRAKALEQTEKKKSCQKIKLFPVED